MRRPLLGLAAGLAVGLAVASGCTADRNSGIAVAAARIATVTEVVDAPANVVPRATATVVSPADGRVAQLYVRDGQQVPAGAILATIDSPSAQQRLAQAEQAAAASGSGSVWVPGVDLSGMQAQTDAAAAVSFAHAEAAVAQIADPVIRAAAQRKLAVGRQQYAAAQAQAHAAVRQFNAGLAGLGSALRSLTAAQRAQARAAVDLARAAVDALTLRAPIAGTVQLGGVSAVAGGGLSELLGQLPQAVQGSGADAASGTSGTGAGSAPGATADLITEGSVVSAGSAVVSLIDVSVLGLRADVDETDVLLVKPGVLARVEFDAVPGGRYDAVVTAVSLSPTTSTRGGVSYHVRLSLGRGVLADDAPAPTPRPGMSAVAHLQVRTARDAVAVPASAVIRAGQRDALWVVRGGAAHRRYVTIGTQGEDMLAVTAGLRAGERVVVRGADRVREGQRLP